MCTLTVSDFDALDTLDADSVLIAGEIIASEKRAEAMRLALSTFIKNPGSVLQRAIAGEDRQQKRLLNDGQRVPGQTGGSVIVH